MHQLKEMFITILYIDKKYIDNIGEVNEEKFGSFTWDLIAIIPEDEMLKITDYIVLP